MATDFRFSVDVKLKLDKKTLGFDLDEAVREGVTRAITPERIHQSVIDYFEGTDWEDIDTIIDNDDRLSGKLRDALSSCIAGQLDTILEQPRMKRMIAGHIEGAVDQALDYIDEDDDLLRPIEGGIKKLIPAAMAESQGAIMQALCNKIEDIAESSINEQAIADLVRKALRQVVSESSSSSSSSSRSRSK